MVKSSLTWVFLSKMKLALVYTGHVSPACPAVISCLPALFLFLIPIPAGYNVTQPPPITLSSSRHGALKYGALPLPGLPSWIPLLAASSSPASTFWLVDLRSYLCFICWFNRVMYYLLIVPLWGILLSVLWFCIASCWLKSKSIS